MDELVNARNVVDALYVWDWACHTIVIMKLPDMFPVAENGGHTRITNKCRSSGEGPPINVCVGVCVGEFNNLFDEASI